MPKFCPKCGFMYLDNDPIAKCEGLPPFVEYAYTEDHRSEDAKAAEMQFEGWKDSEQFYRWEIEQEEREWEAVGRLYRKVFRPEALKVSRSIIIGLLTAAAVGLVMALEGLALNSWKLKGARNPDSAWSARQT